MCSACEIRAVNPVIQSHYALDDGDISPVCRQFKCPGNPLLTHHERIEVPACPPADAGMVRRVDKIRTNFERLDFVSPVGKGCHNAACNGGLSAAAMGPGNDNTRNGHDCSSSSIFTIIGIPLSSAYSLTRWL